MSDAGNDQSVPIGATVQLDGTGSSDPDDDVLSFNWRFKSKPNGSAATLSTPSDGFASLLRISKQLPHRTHCRRWREHFRPRHGESNRSFRLFRGQWVRCGERVEREMKTRPWLFGIALAPQGFARLSALWRVGNTSTEKRAEKDSDNSDSKKS